jgi:GSH-dependent disulfide-bond oxidoreductase
MLSSFDITKKWPATNSDAIQLYSLPTPNGVKISAMLEETGVTYEAHRVDFSKNDQMSPEFLSLNPNNKIPGIIDPNGPGGAPLGLWETGAILIYLAEKTGLFLPTDPATRYETIQWLMWQMGGPGPMFGQLGFFFRMGGKDIEDKRPLERYVGESKRLLSVLEGRLEGRTFIMGDAYTIADIALWPWVGVLDTFYGAGEILDLPSYSNVARWLATTKARPASEAAQKIPAAPE